MRLAVVVVEDEPAVRDAVVRDLAPFADVVRIEPSDDVDDARAVVAEIEADGDLLALVLADHRLPGETGVDWLVELQRDPRRAVVRKVLITGQADQEDTIRAINQASLDHYVAKPWTAEELRDTVREQLTTFVLTTGTDPLPHLRALDQVRVLPALRRRGDR